jgi:HNH endonuclease
LRANLPPLRVTARLLSNVTVQPSGCIVSNYSVGSHGYSQIGWQESGARMLLLGHRAAWIAAYGAIPDGLTVDHICRNRKCINVDHLRLLTNLENARDNGFASRTHCPLGHPYDEANTYRSPSGGRTRRNGRKCRTCAKQRQKDRVGSAP